jgi:hypothetical protein
LYDDGDGEDTMATALIARGSWLARYGVTAYSAIAVLCAIIALVGFWPTYFGRLFSGALNVLPIIHVHAVIFAGWLSLVIAQAVLAGTGRIAWHMKVGRIGMMYGVVLIFVGEATAFGAFGAGVRAGEIAQAQAQLFAPVSDLLIFAPFLGAAWAYRHNPEVHKRLILVATTILLIAPVHRAANWIFGGPPPPLLPVLLLWLAPIAFGLAVDFARRRIVHPVYLLGIAAIIFLKFLRRPLARTDAWNNFVAWVTAFYT